MVDIDGATSYVQSQASSSAPTRGEIIRILEGLINKDPNNCFGLTHDIVKSVAHQIYRRLKGPNFGL